MIVIYTSKVTNRIKYTFDFIFLQHFGIPYRIIEYPEEKRNPSDFYINYNTEYKPGYFNVYQHSLLHESGIREQRLFVSRERAFTASDTEQEEHLPVFFLNTDHFDLRFDIFSCVFYLLSRYEEYLPHEKDQHGRYLSSNSILSNPAFAFGPVVEMWLNDLKRRLHFAHPPLCFKEYEFEYQPTMDVDEAFRYKGRNWLKHPPNFLKKEGLKVLSGMQPDPYEQTLYFLKESLDAGRSPLLFFLMNDDGDNNSKVSPTNTDLKRLIAACKQPGVQIGIHPSYNAFEELLLKREMELLGSSTPGIADSRQHFLRISFPGYYRFLISSGIKTDHSLGYPDVVGFRAGYSRLFYFYDLEKEESTELRLQPFSWMDATFQYYQTKNYEEIIQEITFHLRQIQNNCAKLVTIFHNDLIAFDTFRSVFNFVNKL